jgi:hypothetical protein
MAGAIFFIISFAMDFVHLCVKRKKRISPSKHKGGKNNNFYNYIECEDFHTLIR